MAVPPSIRAVPRPPNTVVVDSGRVGPKQFPVRVRSGIKYVKGGNPQPHNGKVIGHIVGSTFVPLRTKCANQGADALSYGSAAFVRSVVDDIITDLEAVFDVKEVFEIMAISTLRIIHPGISIKRYSTHYSRTFVSVHYPGISISANSVTSLLTRIGKDSEKRVAFFLRRMAAVSKKHHIAIDGTLVQDTSKVNDLSSFSRKSRLKGCKDISVLYAYDIELMEPICAQIFPGNCIDASAYSHFIRNNKIQKGIIIADKGFPPSQIESELQAFPDLHFLTPIKRNDRRIAKYNMLVFEGVIMGIDKDVLYKKVSTKDGKFLYSFKDMIRSGQEGRDYVHNAKIKKNFDRGKYLNRERCFGTVIFESDLDMPPKTVYRCYDDRWILELVFRAYKDIEYLDTTRVQSDFAVIGSEFVNFISTLATCRMINKVQRLEMFDDISFGELLDSLSQVWRRIDAPQGMPKTDDEYWVHALKGPLMAMEKLGLSEPTEETAPKRSYKPQSKQDFVGPKRPRGRPRIHPRPKEPNQVASQPSTAPLAPNV